ncbi:ribonuclease H-like domain-containing protein [Tanacetum coccineum]
MSVYNFEHNSPINSDQDDDVHDPITRISKLDISDPLHLHLNDTTALIVVLIKLKETKNYQVWSCAMLLALEGKNKIGFIDGSCKRSNTDEVLGKQWDREKNGGDVFEKGYYYAIPRQSEESHRVAVGSIAGSSQRNQASAFVSNVPNQRSNQNFSVRPSRPNNLNNSRQGGGSGLNNNRQGEGSGLVCENCGFNGHTIDRCFKIIGYPADFGKKNFGQNFKKQSVSNNNYVGKSTSSGFTDEQMATLISLIKNNKDGKNMQANMAGAKQHMTYTDKELDNVFDISYLKIKLGHPNGTKAYISKIENLRLSNGLTLYDVMVIPEYCVTLIFVHKLDKENKVIVAFDENRCYFLNQDLNLKNVLEIGDQCEGLYYYNDKGIKSNNSTLRYQCFLSQHDWHCRLGHPTDPVINVLKDTLQIDKKDNVIYRGLIRILKLKNDSANVFQDVNHINFFDIEYPEIPNDDERVANDLNKNKSDSSRSSVSGSNNNTADFPVTSGNDVDSSDDFVATQNEEVATLEENVFLKEMDALLRNGTWEIVELPEGRKPLEGFTAVLAVLVTGASQSRQHESHHHFFPVDTNLIHYRIAQVTYQEHCLMLAQEDYSHLTGEYLSITRSSGKISRINA